MSDIIATVQSQEIVSEFIELYDLEYTPGNFAYFYPGGLDDDLDEIEFRNSAGAIKIYVALPMEAESFNITADGAYNRPSITVANIESVFSVAIGGLSYEDLIGQRITRRTTLKKYLVGEASDTGDGNAPVEFPKQVYIIDTIKSKNILSVTFELAAPFDVAGIQLPTRVIIGNACPFKYRGADTAVTRVNRRGGCDWDAEFVKESYSLYLSKNDEYVHGGGSVTNWVNGSSTATQGEQRLTQNAALTQITSTGTRSSVTNVKEYWQALTTQSTAGTAVAPADNNSNWRRFRRHAGYTTQTEYKGYTDKRHNEYVTSGGKLWQVKRNTIPSSNTTAPIEGAFWTEGDICSKSLTACKKRFHALKGPVNGEYVKITTDSNISLPFGGFPGALQRR
jgi:lambda family phage minor tail protein L